MKFIKNDWCTVNETVLICPKCGFEYTHLISAEKTSEEGRLGVELQFECEEGHTFSVNLHNHKGYTVSSIETE